MVAEGKAIFAANCAPCHGPDGGGVVGPNLTDNFWLHGGKPDDIVAIIANGAAEKGMLSWGPILGPAKINAVAAFVISLKGTHPNVPKAAQGEEYKP
ncbi:MAG: c-type cytochrome [Chitinophagaceae bacterium]|nr:c-type cytochrome [Oligoflexus sp.]